MEIINNEEKKYTKVLISKFSPKNGCDVDDGEYLVLIPKNNIPIRDYVSHVFTGLINDNKHSKYGWVKDVPEFTLDEFVNKFIRKRISVSEKKHLQIMFTSIAKLKEGTPVAVTYNQKSMTEKVMELKVHKVFFYKGS